MSPKAWMWSLSLAVVVYGIAFLLTTAVLSIVYN
jgi:hypothetical protein